MNQPTDTRRHIYAVLHLRSWSDFEPEPPAPFPIGIKGDGIGYFAVYDSEDEAHAAADGRPVLPLAVTERKGE